MLLWQIFKNRPSSQEMNLERSAIFTRNEPRGSDQSHSQEMNLRDQLFSHEMNLEDQGK